MIIHYVMQDISEMASSIYIPRGVNVKSLSTTISWPFKPNKTLKVMCTYVDHLILYLASYVATVITCEVVTIQIIKLIILFLNELLHPNLSE